MSFLCFLVFCGTDDSSSLDLWTRQVRFSLQCDHSFLGGGHHSRELRELLLEEECDDFENLVHDKGWDEDSSDDSSWLVKGVPRRPLYKELAYRLLRWSRRCYNPPRTAVKDCNDTTNDIAGLHRLMIPAEFLGLKEEEKLAALPPPPKTHGEIRRWMSQTTDHGIVRLLGMRQTIGSDPRPLVAPSRGLLLQAAEQLHRPNSKSILTVAARARTKHAHRGQERFFGIAKGSPQAHNQETKVVLHLLLNTAVWINIHTFGGLDGDLVVEIREERGYGARWFLRLEEQKTNLQFRGFLEPQVPCGHENGWRH